MDEPHPFRVDVAFPRATSRHRHHPVNDMHTPFSNGRIFRGWFVVAAAFAITFVGYGCAYTFSVFVESLQRDFGASRGSVSLVYSIAGFLYCSFGMISGPLADRWGARRLAVLGMALVGAGLMLASAAHSLVQVYAAYGLGIGLGIGCAYVPALGAVQRWFVKRRGFASGLAVSGIGVGTLAMPPLASHLIDALGWRETWLILGGIAAILGMGMSLLVEDNPGARGLAPDGGLASTETRDTKRSGASIGEALKSRQFIGLYAACLICSFGVFVPFVHLVPYAVDHGITRSSAVVLLGVIGVGSTAGRFVLGGIADRMGRQRFLLVMFLGIGLALATWAFATGFWTLVVFALLFGVTYGGWVAILPAVVVDHFGDRHVSTILGILYTSVAFGTLIGPTAAGFVFNVNHSYTLPIVASAGANILAAIIAWRASKTTRESGSKRAESKRLRATSIAP